MLQPIVGSTGRAKNGMVTPEAGGGKGKGKMMVDEVVEEDTAGEMDVEAMEWNKDGLEEEMDDEMDGARESSDLRGEVGRLPSIRDILAHSVCSDPVCHLQPHHFHSVRL